MTSLARSAWRELISPLFRRPSVVQLAALCHRTGPDGLEIMLVRSSRGRWILPKGWPIEGLNGAQTAMQEAWEEGGVSDGKPAKRSLGFFDTVKRLDSGTEMPCETHVYPIKTRETQPEFPECESRDPTWVSVAKAVDMVEEQGLKDILTEFGAAQAK
jgi:8-oxo-dGTP pyrophosphatase MutT (NUDIX family)